MDAPLALYRRYRPENFSEVIGQDHVTGPLRHALDGNRVHHAYLFSGPRGCGKTTSARILARALNCAQAPTSEPCGTCDSCVSLARGGSGSIDVIEIDAASHGGVDDARDLRERAFFAPVSSRYKVYIVDEAHMVSTQGFNALLKLVEEPPPHVKFIFATTEPDKVIGTIKSRTHHYPFRLVPPKVLGDYLSLVCEREGVTVEPAVLPLVVRAGAGSVRDTLSVLDQLIGGAGPDGVTYSVATGLLGYTPESLLDEIVDAFAAVDAGSVFAVVDKVIETGQDPRRFGEDLLRRLRDLMIVVAVPDATSKGIVDAPGDQADRLTAQAARFGRSDLTRAADVVSQGLTDMRGATAPRLLLELICARVLLPGADDTSEGIHARLDRIERRMAISGTVSVERARPTLPTSISLPSQPDAAAVHAAEASTTGVRQEQAVDTPAAEPPETEPEAPKEQPDAAPTTPPAVPAPAAEATTPPPSGAGPGDFSLVDIRKMWPEVLDRVKEARRFTWIMLSQNSQVSGFDGTTLTVGLVNAGARDSFVNSGSDEILRQALIDALGVDWRIEAIVDSATTHGQPDATSRPAAPDPPHASTPGPPAPEVPTPETPAPETPEAPETPAPEIPTPEIPTPDTPAPDTPAPDTPAPDTPAPETPTSETPTPEKPAPDDAAPQAAAAPEPTRVVASPEVKSSARDAIQPTRRSGERAPSVAGVSDDDAHPDDPTVPDSDLGHDELLARELGAHVIQEIPND
ncbi:MAG: DNA polymerase III subunit gamma and tau [Nocardioidaceae bacterium]